VSVATNATIYYWGAQWTQNNPLTGGDATHSFKGFEDGNGTPTCGGTWTSRPGNSSNPPATVPGIMDIIVSSKITKVGPSISGDIKQIIRISTNAGYGPAPGHVGTAKVLSVVCSSP
jgi:hypothetical protein